jgi:hypothetical protein
MKTCIWYHTADRQPEDSGYYLAYRGWGIAGKADDDSDWGYVYYDKKINEWRDYESMGHYAFVYYWTEAKPDEWVDNDRPVSKRKRKAQPNPALDIAWQRVQDAIRNYDLIKSLSGEQHLDEV